MALALLDEFCRLLGLPDGSRYSGQFLVVRAVVAGGRAEETMDLGRRVLSEHVDATTLLLRLRERVRQSAVDALGGEDELGFLEVFDQSDRRVDRQVGLLEHPSLMPQGRAEIQLSSTCSTYVSLATRSSKLEEFCCLPVEQRV